MLDVRFDNTGDSAGDNIGRAGNELTSGCNEGGSFREVPGGYGSCNKKSRDKG